MIPKIIAVDFDGTLVSHHYPNIGYENPGAFRVLKKLQDEGHKLILWTMRTGAKLDEAIQFCEGKGIIFWGINSNPDQHEWSISPKQYAHLYIDDSALGCPLKPEHRSGRPWVHWKDVEKNLIRTGYLAS